MSLTPRTNQKLVQKLAMTPHLRRSIGMLSMNNATLSVSLDRMAADNASLVVRRPEATDAQTDAAAPAGLEASVMLQIGQTFRSDRDRRIAFLLLDELEPWGWLARPPEDIAEINGLELEDIETVLLRMQGFEPTGLFSRSLSECLYLQAAERSLLDTVLIRMLNNLQVLETDGAADLAAACGCSVEDVTSRLSVLQRLDPKPGLQIESAHPLSTHAPDLIIIRQSEGWAAFLNPDTRPELVVLTGLDKISRRKAERLQKALERRNATVLAVASEVTRRQARYLDGNAPLAPLTRSVIAAATGRHLSTVSRIVSSLTVETPHGVTPMRRLLGRRIRGAGISEHDLAARIERFISEEDPSDPLSDTRLSQMLHVEGVRIMRRTVAKYRTAQGVPPSHQRRRAGQNEPGAGNGQRVDAT